MNQAESNQLKPFAEIAGNTYRFGYRIGETTDVVSAIEMPASVVEQTVLIGASISVRIGTDGLVISRLSSQAVDGSRLPWKVIPIDQLVREAVDSENFHMEEATPDDLKILMSRLELALAFVSDIINQTASTFRGS